MGRHSREPDVGIDILADALPLTPGRWRRDHHNGVDFYRLPTGEDITLVSPTRRERVRTWVMGVVATSVLITTWFAVGLVLTAVLGWLVGD